MTLWPNDLGRCIDGKQVSDLARVMSANTRNGVVPDAEEAWEYAAGEREQEVSQYADRRGF
jgi:hypothetical protein